VKLSRGAQRLLKILRRYAARYDVIFPYRSTLAKEMNVSPRQLSNYIAELKNAGLVAVFQSGPQPATYQVVAAENCKASAKLVQSKFPASAFHPYNNRRTTQEEMRRRFPMKIETPAPELVSLLEWADREGYPVGNGAELEAAERAWKLRKPPAKETGYDREAKSAR
jgi:hypothetical protein